MRTTALLLLFLSIAYAQVGTEGGNISGTNAQEQGPSSWHAVVGQSTNQTFVPITINATPGGLTQVTVRTNSSACPRGPGFINLLFSNSSAPILSLGRGNLTILDQFINRPGQDGTSTFVFSTAFPTRRWGTITGVPTTYTNSPAPATFRMGYLNDGARNIVIIARIVNDQAGFNGSVFDFQLMLPTRNGTATPYYLTVDFACNSPPVAGGGGGTHTPYSNGTGGVPPVEPPIITPPEIPANVTECQIILYCGEWGPCSGGFRRMACTDLYCSTNTEVYRIESCGPRPGEEGPGPLQRPIPRYFVEESPIWFRLIDDFRQLMVTAPALPCSLFLLILLALYLLWRRASRRYRGSEEE